MTDHHESPVDRLAIRQPGDGSLRDSWARQDANGAPLMAPCVAPWCPYLAIAGEDHCTGHKTNGATLATVTHNPQEA